MRVAVWDTFMILQTILDYGKDIATGYCDVSLAVAGPALTALHLTGPTLVLGGGNPKELGVLTSAGLTPLVLLTAHQPEADAVRDMGHEAYCGDIHDMPFPSGRFPVIFSSNVFEHVYAPYLALMECRRVAQPGALAYHAIPEFEGPEHGQGLFHVTFFTEAAWRELFAKTGWAVEAIERVPRGDGQHVYAHYRCRAIPVQGPHAAVMQALVSLKG